MSASIPARTPLIAVDSNSNIISLLNPVSPEKPTAKVSEAQVQPAPTFSLNTDPNPYLLPTASPPQPPAAKRKASEIEEEIQPEDDIPYNDERLENITDSCDVVRRKINSLLKSGTMKVTEFQKEIGVNSKSYGSFMAQKGPFKGYSNSTYDAAYRFFKKREIMGIKIPVKRVKKEEEAAKTDVSAITLEGEATTSVPVYDSCDEMRRKIRAFLAQPGITQAGFLREIAKTYPEGRKIQSKVLNDFLGKRGASSGNTSAVFYSSYVFFEKLRIRDGKPKSKHRLDMERMYEEDGGFDVKHRSDGRTYTCMVGQNVYEDGYGKIRVSD